MTKPVLYGLRYSPWSRKARWALDAHGVDVDYREYTVMLGEPALRLRSGRFFGKLSVPVLLKDDGNLFDSFEIAKWSSQGVESALFPPGRDAEIASWNEWAELISSEGRARTTAHVIRDPEALRDAIPGPLLGFGPLTTMIGKSGAHFILVKYGRVDLDEVQTKLRHYLQTVRESLADNEYLLGEFTYADVTIAMAMQFVAPVDESVIRIGERSRRYWTDEALAEDFADVMAWRDRVFELRPE